MCSVPRDGESPSFGRGFLCILPLVALFEILNAGTVSGLVAVQGVSLAFVLRVPVEHGAVWPKDGEFRDVLVPDGVLDFAVLESI